MFVASLKASIHQATLLLATVVISPVAELSSCTLVTTWLQLLQATWCIEATTLLKQVRIAHESDYNNWNF